MPATENDRRNLQQPTLENPALPDHDRRNDPSMHVAIPEDLLQTQPDLTMADQVAFDEKEMAPPDREFKELLEAGFASNNGRIHDDPNNRLTSDPAGLDGDPEDRGESLPDIEAGDKH